MRVEQGGGGSAGDRQDQEGMVMGTGRKDGGDVEVIKEKRRVGGGWVKREGGGEGGGGV